MQRTRPKISLLTLALGALAIAAVAVAALLVGPDSPKSSTTTRTATVTKGVIQTTVSGTGNLQPRKTYDLSFGASGKVNAIYVAAGDHVAKGDLLATLDTTDAEVALAQANADLTDAKDQLDTAETAEEEEDEEEAAAEDTTTTTTTTTQSQSQSQSPSESSGSTISVESAQAKVSSAELSVSSAEEALASTKLRAPANGTIASVSGAEGDTVSAGSSGASDSSSDQLQSMSDLSSSSSSSSSSSFITLVNVHRLTLQVALSESDIGKVRVGQPATVTINALSDGEDVAATVTDVAVLPSSSTDSSAVSYPVTLTLDQTAHGIRTGMSASADIVISETSGLSIPTQALRGSTVTVERDGKRSTQTVVTGLAGNSSTQVVSGLEEGDKVVVRSTSAAAGATSSGARQQTRSGLGGGLGGGGGGAFPAGGGGPPGGVRP